VPTKGGIFSVISNANPKVYNQDPHAVVPAQSAGRASGWKNDPCLQPLPVRAVRDGFFRARRRFRFSARMCDSLMSQLGVALLLARNSFHPHNYCKDLASSDGIPGTAALPILLQEAETS